MIFKNSSEITLRFYEKNYDKLGEINNIDDFMTYVHMCDYLKIPTLLKNMLKYIIDNNIKGTDYKTLHEMYSRTSPRLIEQIRCISTIQKNNICDIMAVNGYKKCLEYTKDFNIKWTENNSFNAVVFKQFDCFMYLIENGCPCDFDKCLIELIRFKNMDLIKFIYNKCTKSNKTFVNEAAKVGSLEILIFLIVKGFEFSEESYFKAIENGNLSCVKYFYNKHYHDITNKHLDIALTYNRPNVVNFFEENKSKMTENKSKMSEEENISNSKRNTIKIIVKSESEKSLDLLKETLKINKQITPQAISPRPFEKTGFDISENKLLESLKTIPENNCQFESIKNMFLNYPNKDKKFTKEAALNNNYDLLKFLLDNGYPFDKSIPEIAAMKGFIKIFDVLSNKDIPLNVQICNIALKAKQKKCLEYLIEKKCPGYQLFIKPLSDLD